MKRIISFLLRKVPRKHLQKFSHLILKSAVIFYRGNQVECPVCGKTFRKFLPYGRIRSRSNALCPSCLSLERHRLLWLYFDKRTDLFTAPHTMLHIAPELCFMKKFREMKDLEYKTADIESPLADIKMDIHDIPFDNNRFDIILCNHVMEHVDDDIKAMKEICRVLNTGGWAIIQVPFFHPLPEFTFEDPSIVSKKEREKAFGQDDHLRKYGKDYGRRLESAGFKVVEDDFVKSLTDAQIKRYCVPANEIIYLCSK